MWHLAFQGENEALRDTGTGAMEGAFRPPAPPCGACAGACLKHPFIWHGAAVARRATRRRKRHPADAGSAMNLRAKRALALHPACHSVSCSGMAIHGTGRMIGLHVKLRSSPLPRFGSRAGGSPAVARRRRGARLHLSITLVIRKVTLALGAVFFNGLPYKHSGSAISYAFSTPLKPSNHADCGEFGQRKIQNSFRKNPQGDTLKIPHNHKEFSTFFTLPA